VCLLKLFWIFRNRIQSWVTCLFLTGIQSTQFPLSYHHQIEAKITSQSWYPILSFLFINLNSWLLPNWW
jgi:hypothetical protein